VQTRLQQKDDYSDAIDGVRGPSTEAGVRAYHRSSFQSEVGFDNQTLPESADDHPASQLHHVHGRHLIDSCEVLAAIVQGTAVSPSLK
jgi:peptidoglycan hydrolase-like protein with peptidoglycan-binding domain